MGGTRLEVCETRKRELRKPMLWLLKMELRKPKLWPFFAVRPPLWTDFVLCVKSNLSRVARKQTDRSTNKEAEESDGLMVADIQSYVKKWKESGIEWRNSLGQIRLYLIVRLKLPHSLLLVPSQFLHSSEAIFCNTISKERFALSLRGCLPSVQQE